MKKVSEPLNLVFYGLYMVLQKHLPIDLYNLQGVRSIVTREGIVEEKHNTVKESGMQFWDEYQANLDELCDVSTLETVYPSQVLIIASISFLMITIGMVLAWSEVYITDEGARIIYPSTIGFLILGAFSGIFGYYIGKVSKRLAFGLPLAFIISIFGIIAGLIIGPELIIGRYPVWWARLAVSVFPSALIMALASFAAMGTFQQD